MRQLGAFLPGEGVGGAGTHWNGVTWRWSAIDHALRTHYEQRYGKNFVPSDMAVQDWPVSYKELEPYYDRFERTAGVSGKAGNLRGQIQEGGNVFEPPRERDYPLPPLESSYAQELFAKAARQRTPAITRFRARRPTPRAPTPTRTARSSARACIAATASASAARPTPRAARTSR